MSSSHLIQHYDRLARRYDQRWRAYTHQTLERALGVLKLSGQERILDVGCGTGELERMAIDRFPQLTIVGIDAAPGMIALARQKLAGVSQVDFQVAEAEQLPFGPETFHVVLCANMLHHARQPREVLRECVRVLRYGGRLAVVDWCRDFWHCRAMHYWLRLSDRTYVKMYRLVEVGGMLDELGLTMDRACCFIAKPFYGMMRCVAEKTGY